MAGLGIALGVLGIGGGLAGVALRIFAPGAFAVAQAAAVKVSKAIPPKAWLAIAAVAVLVGGYFVHQHKANGAIAAAYARGASDEDAKWAKKLAAAHTAALRQAAKTEASQAQTSQKDRNQHEQDLRNDAGRADAQRVRGPGAAAAPAGGGQGDHPDLSAAAGGPQQAAPAVDAGLDRVSSNPELAIVRWPDLVDHAQQCDAAIDEARTWRRWYAEQAAANRQARGVGDPPPPAAAGDSAAQ